MRILFNLINAAQAAQLTAETVSKAEIGAIDYVEIRKQTEIADVNQAIQAAANMGMLFTQFWIRYVDTYNQLVSAGYNLSGGIVREKLPEAMQAAWGKQSDQVTISWANVNQ